MSPLLLDTNALIWIASGRPLAAAAAEALEDAGRKGTEVLVTPISAWEIGMLTARGRIALASPPASWFARTLSAAGFGLAEQTTGMLIDSSFLPGSPPRDPADRIIIATAREKGLRLVTRDRAILDYAGAGHVSALAC